MEFHWAGNPQRRTIFALRNIEEALAGGSRGLCVCVGGWGVRDGCVLGQQPLQRRHLDMICGT